MPPRYQQYRANPALAKAYGGLGYGLMDAGKQMFQYGKEQADEKYRQDQSKIQQNQFNINQDNTMKRHGDNLTQGYARISQADRHHSDSMGLQWANHNQRNRDTYSTVNTTDGVYAVNTRDPNQKIYLGGYANTNALPSYKTVTTKDGVYAINSKDPSIKVRMGDAPRSDANELSNMLQQERLDKMKRENTDYLVGHYGNDTWSEFTPAMRQYALDMYKKDGVIAPYENKWFSNDYIVMPQQGQDDTAEIQQLNQALDKMNKM